MYECIFLYFEKKKMKIVMNKFSNYVFCVNFMIYTSNLHKFTYNKFPTQISMYS